MLEVVVAVLQVQILLELLDQVVVVQAEQI